MKYLAVTVDGALGTRCIDVVLRSGVTSGQAVSEAREEAVRVYNQWLEEGKKATKAGDVTEHTAFDDHLERVRSK